MEEHKLEVLRNVIGRWKVDVEKGTVETKRGLVSYINNEGRLVTGTSFNGKSYQFYVHQIIAYAGGLGVLGKEVNHKNGNKLDNRIINLEVVSPAENKEHQILNGLFATHINAKGSKHHNTKLKEEDVIRIRDMYATGDYTQKQLSAIFDTHISGISRIVKRVNWKHI